MRPIQFQRLAPSTGLTIGAAAANGLNTALQNIAKMRMQRSQMAYHQAMSQGMNAFRNAQAEALRDKYQSANLSKVQLTAALLDHSKNGGLAGISAKNLESLQKDAMKDYLQNANPDDMQKLLTNIHTSSAQHQLAPEVSGQVGNLNVNEQGMLKSMLGGQTKENVAGTQAGARLGAAQTYADSREYVADQGKAGRIGAAQISANGRTNPGTRADLQSMRDVAKQMEQTSASLAALDKPTPMGAIPLDDATKANLKQKYTQDLSNYHQQYQEIHDRITGNGQKAQPSGQAAPQGQQGASQPFQNGSGPLAMPGSTPQAAQPRVLSSNQWQSAQPGDYVASPKGGYHKALGGGNFDPTPIQQVPGAPSSQAPSVGPPAPQPGTLSPPQGQAPMALPPSPAASGGQ